MFLILCCCAIYLFRISLKSLLRNITSKVKCFNYGKLGHYASKCRRKKGKGEASDSKTAPAKAEKAVETNDDCAMSAHAPLEKRWGDIEL